MSLTMFRIGLRQCPGGVTLRTSCQPLLSSSTTIRSISYITRANNSALVHSKSTISNITPFSHTIKPKVRYNSTVQQASGSPANTAFNWNAFFRLRKSRRRYSLASSWLSLVGVGFGAFYYLSTHPEVGDELAKVVPVDPIFCLGGSLIASLLLGWLVGPFFGTSVWNFVHRSVRREFASKEKQFFQRIRQHRVNPTGANPNNPVPDYYGEKISSVSGYRQWLKDQRVFNRKREGVYTGPQYPALGLPSRSR